MSTFPVLRALVNNSEIECPNESSADFIAREAVWVKQGIYEYDHALWSAGNVISHLQSKEMFNIGDIGGFPCIPPFDYVWIEGVLASGVPTGIAVNRIQDDRDLFSVHRFNLDPLRKVHGTSLVGHMYFRPDGTLDKWGIYGTEYMAGVSQEGIDAEEQKLGRGIGIALSAFRFAHCKNVQVVERLPKRHEQREAKRRGEPILKYHEIVIDPKKPQNPSNGANRHDDHPAKALHLVRGHFATYTEDRPLFGKYTGTFWVPAHVRGDAEAGVIKSSYRVTP